MDDIGDKGIWQEKQVSPREAMEYVAAVSAIRQSVQIQFPNPQQIA
jgi:hypothetical protein